jgi:hypothetical protein
VKSSRTGRGLLAGAGVRGARPDRSTASEDWDELVAISNLWFTDTLPGKPAVPFIQTVNAHSTHLAAKLGFGEVERYEANGVEQWFSMRSPVTPSD